MSNTLQQFRANKPTICLNMIVKNESKNIIRCLKSVVSYINFFVIHDTGSVDNTIDLIKQFFASYKIQGIIKKTKFIDFSTSRNFALFDCARRTDYTLFIDADMVLVNSFYDFDKLNKDAYYIFQENNGTVYKNIRLVRNNGRWIYKGSTHEVLYCLDEKIETVNIDKDFLYIKDYDDGGCKENKLERDINLLKKDIKNKIQVSRSLFYLANTYFSKKDFSSAIYYYKKYIDIGDWDQQIWFSYLRIGLSYLLLKNYPLGVYYLTLATEICPKRIENLHYLSQYFYSNAGSPIISEIYKKEIYRILDENHNTDDFLFIDEKIYDLYKNKN
jgi:tetratricopeptide (TPR) repeat protein